MSKREEFTTALKEAMQNKDQVSISTIRLIMAAMKDRDIAARSNDNAEGISDAEILSMMQSMIKQRQESSVTYAEAGRDDLAEREMDEIAVLKKFLPAQMSDDEVSATIDKIIADTGASSIKDMGKVMGVLKSDYAGQIDMAKAGGLVKSKLAA